MPAIDLIQPQEFRDSVRKKFGSSAQEYTQLIDFLVKLSRANLSNEHGAEFLEKSAQLISETGVFGSACEIARFNLPAMSYDQFARIWDFWKEFGGEDPVVLTKIGKAIEKDPKNKFHLLGQHQDIFKRFSVHNQHVVLGRFCDAMQSFDQYGTHEMFNKVLEHVKDKKITDQSFNIFLQHAHIFSQMVNATEAYQKLFTLNPQNLERIVNILGYYSGVSDDDKIKFIKKSLENEETETEKRLTFVEKELVSQFNFLQILMILDCSITTAADENRNVILPFVKQLCLLINGNKEKMAQYAGALVRYLNAHNQDEPETRERKLNFLLGIMKDNNLDYIEKLLNSRALDYLYNPISDDPEQRAHANKIIENFYTAINGSPALVDGIPESDFFKNLFNNFEPGSSVQTNRLVFMRLLYQESFVECENTPAQPGEAGWTWTAEKNTRLLQHAFTRYTDRAKTICENGQTLAQQKEVLNIATELQQIAVMPNPEQRPVVQYRENAVLKKELLTMVSGYTDSWTIWRSSSRISQSSDLKRDIAVQTAGQSQKSYYHSVMDTLLQARKTAMENDHTINNNSSLFMKWNFFKHNSKGHSIYLTTLNKMIVTVSQAWAQDAAVGTDFAHYIDCLKTQVTNIHAQLNQHNAGLNAPFNPNSRDSITTFLNTIEEQKKTQPGHIRALLVDLEEPLKVLEHYYRQQHELNQVPLFAR